MKPVTYRIKVDMENTGAKQTGIKLKQGDSGMIFIFSVFYEGNKYFDADKIPKAVIQTSNGASYIGDCAMDESGVYIYTFKGTELSCAGKVAMDLKFELDGGRESTYTIIFECVKDTIGKSVETSSMNIDDALKLRDQLAQEIAQAPDVVGTITEAGQAAVQDINEAAQKWIDEFPDQAELTGKVEELNSNLGGLSFSITENGILRVTY